MAGGWRRSRRWRRECHGVRPEARRVPPARDHQRAAAAGTEGRCFAGVSDGRRGPRGKGDQVPGESQSFRTYRWSRWPGSNRGSVGSAGRRCRRCGRAGAAETLGKAGVMRCRGPLPQRPLPASGELVRTAGAFSRAFGSWPRERRSDDVARRPSSRVPGWPPGQPRAHRRGDNGDRRRPVRMLP
jgi:hypothetical protein